MDRISRALGRALREARAERGLTLHELARRSRDRFKPSSVGGYERGERAMSVRTLVDLATFLGVPADRVLARALSIAGAAAARETVIDLNRLAAIQGEEARAVAEYVHRIRDRRGDFLTGVITLRSGDLESLALAAGRDPEAFLGEIRSAIRTKRTERRAAAARRS